MRRLLVWLLPVVTALVIAGSLMPERTKVLLGTGARFYIIDVYGHTAAVNPHRIVHWVAFATLTVVALAAGTLLWQRLAAAGAVVLTALAMEYAQHRIYLNAFEWGDVRDDIRAVVLAAIAVQAAVWWKRKRESGSIR